MKAFDRKENMLGLIGKDSDAVSMTAMNREEALLLSIANAVPGKVANIADSEATTIAALKEDFNGLLAALKAAGVMAPDAEEEPGT